MGSDCSCCTNNTNNTDPNTQALRLNQRWIQAVNEGNLVGCKFIHLEDPDVLDQVVDIKTRDRAIHMAVRKKNVELLEYLLDNQCDLDCQSANGNTALHEAALNNDLSIIKLLIQYGADVDIRNKNNKLSKELCNNNIKREFTKNKIERLRKIGPKVKTNTMQTETADDIFIGGVSIHEVNNKLLRDYNKITQQETEASKKQKLKKEEIENRTKNGIVLTNFGRIVGCEIDEIGFFIERVSNKDNLWNKIVKDETTITRQKELYKLILYLTLATLKQKNNSETKTNKTPDDESIKELVSKIKEKLPKEGKQQKFTLTKEDFVNKFHNYLYEIHDAWPKIF